jgi:hypothetical protein
LRRYLIAAALCAFAAPALSQPLPYPDVPEAEIVDDLPSSIEIDAMGAAMGRMVGAVMDIPIGGIVEAMEPGRDMSAAERNQTIGDVASRDDPYAEERMRGSIDALTANMGLMTEQLAVLLPVLRRSMTDIERRMEEAIDPYDYDWDE